MNLVGPTYHGSDVLILGGLGFIGSSLAIRLVELGARVTLVDSFLPGQGANWFNIEPIRKHPQVSVHLCEIGDTISMRHLCRDQQVIFQVAALADHVSFTREPGALIENNVTQFALLLEVLISQPRRPRLVFTGTRGQYGAQDVLPVKETAPFFPRGIHELSKAYGEMLLLMYSRLYDLPSVALRLGNIYGPRAQVASPVNGVLNWFVRLAVEGHPIPLMGEGNILRDFLYIDDCVDALIRAGAQKSIAPGEVFNIGSDQPTSYREAAEILRALSGAEIASLPFSPERKLQEPGDFYPEISKAKKALDWAPRTHLRQGLRQYYHWLGENFYRYALPHA